MLLTFLSFSLFLMQQTPHAIVVKCDGSVYDVDVDVTDFNTRNTLLTQKLLKQDYQYHKLRREEGDLLTKWRQ